MQGALTCLTLVEAKGGFMQIDEQTGLKQEYTMLESAKILGYHPVYVRQLVSEGTLQSRKTPSGKRFIALQTLLAWARSKGADVEDLRFNLAETQSLF